MRAYGIGDTGQAVYLDFRDAIKRDGEDVIRAKYGNLFHMYKKITDEDPVSRADAHLPRRPLHDGRALGGLQLAVQHPRVVRA